MSEIGSCTLESVGKVRKRVAGVSKRIKKNGITGRVKPAKKRFTAKGKI